MTFENGRAPMIRYMAGGSLAERGVMDALTGVPDGLITRFQLPGFGLRVQPLDDVRPDWVKQDLISAWANRGVNFYGGITLSPAQDESAEVAMVVMSLEQWRKYARPRLVFWNYQEEGKKREEGWWRKI